MQNIEYFYNIDGPSLEVVNSDSRKMGTGDFLTFGNDNKYPQHLFDLFKGVPVLRSVVEGSSLLASNLFSGESVSCDYYQLMQYIFLYGSCPVLVRSSRDHRSYYLTPLDPRYVRTTMDCSKFAYSELDGFRKHMDYPAYAPGIEGSSILYIRLNDFAKPYGLPLWSSALRSVQILDQVAGYHNANLMNGFNPSCMISFNNGTPSSEDKAEIERLVNNKFGGADNAGKVMLSFSDDKEHEPTVTPITTEDRSARYHDLVDSCNHDLFTAFRGHSALFGAPSPDTSALTEEEYGWKMALYIRFTLGPICSIVHRALSKFGVAMKDPMGIVESTRESAEGEE